MNNVQVLQNKAAKIILDRPLYSSASEALIMLKWIPLEQRRFYHSCTIIYKCINGYTNHTMELRTNGHDYMYMIIILEIGMTLDCPVLLEIGVIINLMPPHWYLDVLMINRFNYLQRLDCHSLTDQ